MYQCTTGRHVWTRAEDARCCCNGYTRILLVGDVTNATNIITVEGVLAGRAWQRNGEKHDPDFSPRKSEQSLWFG